MKMAVTSLYSHHRKILKNPPMSSIYSWSLSSKEGSRVCTSFQTLQSCTPKCCRYLLILKVAQERAARSRLGRAHPMTLPNRIMKDEEKCPGDLSCFSSLLRTRKEDNQKRAPKISSLERRERGEEKIRRADESLLGSLLVSSLSIMMSGTVTEQNLPYPLRRSEFVPAYLGVNVCQLLSHNYSSEPENDGRQRYSSCSADRILIKVTKCQK
jgi:hypothetical protein